MLKVIRIIVSTGRCGEGIIMWKGYENYDHYFDPSQLEEFLDEVLSSGLEISQKGKIEYYNIPAAFDIETSSFYTEKEEKIANIKESFMKTLNRLNEHKYYNERYEK